MIINTIVDIFPNCVDFVYIVVNDHKFKIPANSNIIYKYAAVGV